MDHTVVHFEIPADDVEKLRKFYSELFGWKIERMPGPVEYWGIGTVPVDEKGMPERLGVNGGISLRPRRQPVRHTAKRLSVEEFEKTRGAVLFLGFYGG
jgi:predicted enzyme related to lactoylglutathione lyase